MTTTRRELLAGAGAAAVLAQLGLIRRRAAAAHPRPGEAMATRYTLDPAVTYLNHASIGTVPAAVQRAHADYLELCETNPWLYVWSEPWVEPRRRVRAAAAELVGGAADAVAIVHNTTELFNVLAQGMPLGPGDEVLFSNLNHAGASVCWDHHAETRGYSVRRFELPLAEVPTLDADALVARYEAAIGPKTRVLVLPHVDNLVGLRHPVHRIAAMARERGVRWIAVDGAQTAGMLPIDVHDMGCDVYATSCHKWLQSPKGLGLAWIGEPLRSELRPMWVTWGQERWAGQARRFEDYGTRAVPAVLALGDAIAFQRAVPDDDRVAHYRALRAHLRRRIAERDDLLWRSPGPWALGASLVAVELPGRKAAEVAPRLFAEHGIVVRPFSLPDLDALRISPNLANDVDDLERLLAALAETPGS